VECEGQDLICGTVFDLLQHEHMSFKKPGATCFDPILIKKKYKQATIAHMEYVLYVSIFGRHGTYVPIKFLHNCENDVLVLYVHVFQTHTCTTKIYLLSSFN
jgi:hypothetical protein